MTTADCRKYVYCMWHTFIQNVRKQQVLNITYITRHGLATFTHNNFNPEERGSKSYQKVLMYTDKTVCMYTDLVYMYTDNSHDFDFDIYFL